MSTSLGESRRAAGQPSAAVLAPAPLLTVTIEHTRVGDEVHLHPGGQGVWIARLLATLGVDVVLCASFGGESGLVALGLLERMWGLEVRAVDSSGSNGVYVHDRRSGVRTSLAESDTSQLTRHEVDELYGAAFVAGLEADVVVLGGPESPSLERGTPTDVIPAEVYHRLAIDLRRNGTLVVADLSGVALDAAADGGVDLLKASDEELVLDERVADRSVPQVVAAMREFAGRGVGAVVVTRAGEPSLALVDGVVYEVQSPRMEVVDDRGAGDSVTAGVAAALAHGHGMFDALRMGAAAGALNVSRRGFGSGSRREIEALAHHVTVRELT